MFYNHWIHQYSLISWSKIVRRVQTSGPEFNAFKLAEIKMENVKYNGLGIFHSQLMKHENTRVAENCSGFCLWSTCISVIYEWP